MSLDASPTVTVRIFFESNWRGTVASQLLATATATRPPFEFVPRIMPNPYTYATSKRTTFGLGISNAADKRHYTYATGCTGSTPASVYPEPGRTFTASARVRF